ncbi:uncharacterized protein LOC128127709 [Lactuca sativa]|uniref:uncharacterized protein LOC128127709 n=1 Tax=Lactuca sativa TaxID=4236 RepID=UPI0022AEDE4F|nr:uncharacterized protein LOC128127709 [Lactuca sativa]
MKQVKLSCFFSKRQRPNPNESGEECSQIPITNQSIPSVSNPNATPQTPITNQSINSVSNATPQTPCSNQPNDNVDLKDLPKDPTDRPLITSCKPIIRDDVRRAYLLQGPDLIGQKGGRDAFVSQGFDTWNKKDAFRTHVGGVDSFHNKAKEKYIFNNTLENAAKNNQLISPKIQKELVQCFAQEVLLSIREEIGQDVFALLVDESSDVSKKEQMAIVLRYVDSLGFVKEIFIGLVHVKDTSSLTHKNAINEVLTSNKLSFSKQISLVVNVVCASCKRKDLLREQARERVQKGLCSGELETGRWLNQETTLVRAGETRWGSHFNTLTSLMKLFADVVVVLDFVKEEGGSLANHQQASGILAYFKSYEFVFYLHMMYDILHLTGTLSKQLQRKDLDILEAASMLYIGARNRRTTKTNRFYFEVEIFNTAVDMQLTEYRDQFSETSTQLLEYMGALSPCDSFAQFDKSKLLKLGKLYKYDFDDSDMIDLEGQFEIFYHSCIKDERFTSLKGISDLSCLMTDLRNKIGDEFLNDALFCNVETKALAKVENEKAIERF